MLTTPGLVARCNDRLQRLVLVRQIALRGLDQVGDQIVPAFQLDVDLRERVPQHVSQRYQTVVNGHRVSRKQQDHTDETEARIHAIPPVTFGR